MIIRQTVFALAIALFILVLAAGLRYAEGAGMIEADSAKRAMQIVIGLFLAAYANIMPKHPGRRRGSPRAEGRALAALRFGGWSLTLAGLAYAALWAFAPLPLADMASMVVVAAALIATLGYAILSFTACRSLENASTG
jgi:uncharacterized membrane protein